MKILTYILLFFILISKNIYAQDITVKTTIDTNIILIGDQINYNIFLTKPVNSKYTFPNLTDTLTSGVIIVEKENIDTIKNDKKNITLKQTYKITSFDSGYYALPPVYFTQKKDTNIDTIAITNPLLFRVLTLKVDTTKQKIADIKDVYDAPMTFKEFLMEYYPYIIAIIIILLIAIGIIIYIKKHKKKPVVEKRFIKPKEPAHIIAFRELDKLKNEKLWQKNKIKQYYVRLTEIIRKYIEYRYEILAMEQTSNDIINALKPIIKNNDTINYLNNLFATADLVKFAKYKPLPNEHDTSYKNAYNFIDATKLIENMNNKNKNNEQKQLQE